MTADASTTQSLEWQARNYVEDLPDDIGSFRRLLEDYSNIPPENVDKHLRHIRDKAWAIHRYPCIGRWSFTQVRGVDHPSFQALVKRLKQPESRDAFLDVGCCVGQVVRKLAFDGVDPARLYGTDLHPEYLDLGFELFNDRERFGPDSFIAANLLDPNDQGSKKMDGKVTVMHAANFFHLFDWDEQVVVATRMIRFLKPGTTNAVIIGGMIGSVKPGAFTSPNGHTRYLHDPETFQRLWDEAGRMTGTEWKVTAGWINIQIDLPSFPDESRYLGFTVRQAGQAVSQ